MSVDRTGIIARGFLIDSCPYGKLPDEFVDEWIISFNSYSDEGPYLVGYYITRAFEEGVPFELGCTLGDPMWDNFLREACRKAGIPDVEIKTYFGVKLS